MNFLDELTWRGLLQDSSDPELFSKLKPGQAFYVGFDPTAPSLQVGNLIQIITAIRLTNTLGLQPILLFGGATGMIGDPGGRSAERNLLPMEQVAQNVSLQTEQARSLWRSAGCSVEPKFVNNRDWSDDITMISFLRDVGKHFTVNYMLQKESVKTRLSGAGISYTEFSYMLLQANDFDHLFNTMDCRLQIGGSDQWGNITAGLELIRRRSQGEAYAFSVPLITNSEGKKFGKSAGNAVWLDSSLTSPYNFHQFWLNTPDTDVIKLLKVFSFKTPDEIGKLTEQVESAPHERVAQRELADFLCTLVHGQKATEDAKRAAQVLFGGSLEGLDREQIEEIFSEAPSTTLSREEMETLDILGLLAKTVANSKGEARRLLQAGGIYVNNVRCEDSSVPLSATELKSKSFMVLRSGKKKYHLVNISPA
jgi:tyrosyl-tRNA synthetase